MPKKLFEEFKEISLEDLKQNSQNLVSKPLIDNISNLNQNNAHSLQPLEAIDMNITELKEPLFIPINSLVQPKGLPI